MNIRKCLLAILATAIMVYSFLPPGFSATGEKELETILNESAGYLVKALRNNDDAAWQKAEEILTAGLAKYPNEASLLVSRSNIRLNTGRPVEAREDLVTLMEVQPSGQVQMGICLISERLGLEKDKSIECYRKALEYDPGAPYETIHTEMEWLIIRFLAEESASLENLKRFFRKNQEDEIVNALAEILKDFDRKSIVFELIPSKDI